MNVCLQTYPKRPFSGRYVLCVHTDEGGHAIRSVAYDQNTRGVNAHEMAAALRGLADDIDGMTAQRMYVS